MKLVSPICLKGDSRGKTDKKKKKIQSCIRHGTYLFISINVELTTFVIGFTEIFVNASFGPIFFSILDLQYSQ
jgi:hypothetical protein